MDVPKQYFTYGKENDLIELVRARPILYDRNCSDYKKQQSREEAWKEVAKILKQNDNECRRRWRSLRDSFIKYHKSNAKKSVQRRRQWSYYDSLHFLIPHIEWKDTKDCGESYELRSNHFINPFFQCFEEEFSPNSTENEEEISKNDDDSTICNRKDDSRSTLPDKEAGVLYPITDMSDTKKDEDMSLLSDKDSQIFYPITEMSDANEYSRYDSSCFVLSDMENNQQKTENGSIANNWAPEDASQNQNLGKRATTAIVKPNKKAKLCSPVESDVGDWFGDEVDERSSEDSDQLFLLSNLAAMKRLTTKQNAEARKRIAQVLYEIEFSNV